MVYRVLADAVVVLHLAFILFGLFGALLAMCHRAWLLLHVPALVWICLLEFNGWICPLTPLENQLRRAAGEAGYSGGFIEHYLIPIIYPAALTPQLQVWLGVVALLVNAVTYTLVLRRWHRTGSEKKT